MSWTEAADLLEAAVSSARAVLEDPAAEVPEPPGSPDFVLEGTPEAATRSRIRALLSEVDRLAVSVETRKAEIRAELDRLGTLRQAGRGYLRATGHGA